MRGQGTGARSVGMAACSAMCQWVAAASQHVGQPPAGQPELQTTGGMRAATVETRRGLTPWTAPSAGP